MVEAEAQRQAWSRIHRIDGTARTGMGQTRVETVKEIWIYEEQTEQTDIEKACLNENEARFTQSKNNPCMISPLVDELGLLGTGVAADSILEGNYIIPEGVDPGVQTVFDNLQRHDSIPLQQRAQHFTCEEHRLG